MTLRIAIVMAGLFGLLMSATLAKAEPPYAFGDTISPFTLEDQHGEARSVDASVDVILFSRDMDGGDVLKAAFADTPPAEMSPGRKIVYIADIHEMPRLVARLFALPAMRRRPYPMLLDRDGETTARLPDEKGKATIIYLEGLVVMQVFHLDDPEALKELLAGRGRT